MSTRWTISSHPAVGCVWGVGLVAFGEGVDGCGTDAFYAAMGDSDWLACLTAAPVPKSCWPSRRARSLPMPHNNAASERTPSQGNNIGKEHCSELALYPIDANPSVKRLFAQPQLFSECIKMQEWTITSRTAPQMFMSMMTRHSSSRYRLLRQFDDIAILLHLCRYPASLVHAMIRKLSSLQYRWAKSFLAFFQHTKHHVMCKGTRPHSGIVKPLKFPPTSDSRNV